MVWPALIAAGASLAGSAIESNAANSGIGRQFQADFSKWQLSEQRRDEVDRYERLVRGAEKAGLHPLFAMGAGSANFSPTAVAGQAPTGNHMGTGIARAGEHIARGLSNRGVTRRAEEIHDLTTQKMRIEIERDQVALMAARSALARAQQGALWGDASTGITGNGDVKTYPYGRKAGPPLRVRPISATARQSLPQYSEAVGPKGRRQILNQDLGLDEVGQVEYVARPWYDYFASGFNNKFRPKMTDPAAYYYYWKNYYKRRGKKQ